MWGWAFDIASILAALGVLVAAALQGERPEPGALLLFGALLVWAENAAVLLPTRVTLSPSFMVVVASLAAFRGHGSVLGAGLVGLCGGIAFEKLRRRRFRVVLCNCAQYVLSGAGAGAVELVLRHSAVPHWAALAGGGVGFALINVVLVLVGVSLETGSPPLRVWADMAPALPNYVAFGLLGTLIGELYHRLGPLSVVVLVAPLVVARSSFVALLKLRQAYRRLEGLYGFTKQVGTALDVDTIVRSTAREAGDVLHAGHVELVLVGTADGSRRCRRGPDGEIEVEVAPIDPSSLAGRVLASGAAAAVVFGSAGVAIDTELAAAGLHDALMVPIGGEGGIVGAIVVADRVDGSPYGPDDLQMLQTLANHAGVALQNGRLIDRLRHDRSHDALTGLLNRSGFQDALEAVATGAGAPAAVLLMDIDRFKEVNDSLGHDSGDRLLQQVALRLTDLVGRGGSVARLGGDEFAVLVPDRGAQMVDELVAPLLAATERPFVVGDLNLEINASVGLALFPEHGTDAVALLQRADIAMYASKHSMRSFEVYHPDHDRNTPHRLMLAADLRHAIERGEMQVYYQPKASLPEGRVIGVEALLRWTHPDLGFVPPDEFIPLAEHTGFIRQLTEWTIGEATAQCAAWRRRGLDLSVAVNLSARVLVDLDLPLEVDQALARSGLPHSAFTLEVTESSIMSDPIRNIGVLQRLSDMGITLSIDDFGTGYSSLAYLKQLPVAEVKVDKAFVINMARDPDDVAIVRSTIDLARNLRLRVVAEGVEDRVTWDQLSVLGCDVAQGYFLSRPVPPATFERWLTGYGEPVAVAVGS